MSGDGPYSSVRATGAPRWKPRIDHRILLPLHRKLMRPLAEKTELLLLLGTMRSGSTLLSNILLSNCQIEGIGESHIIYDRPERLLDLRYWVFRKSHRYPRPKNYLFDKVLHPEYTPDLGMLIRSSRAKIVFIVRDPEATKLSIQSMIEEIRPGELGNLDIWSLLEYRYQNLCALCDEIPPDAPVFALSYEALLSAPEQILLEMTAFLNLKNPLSPEYNLPKWSGGWGIGDGSAKLKSGRLIGRKRKQSTDADTPYTVSNAYEALRVKLSQRASPVFL